MSANHLIHKAVAALAMTGLLGGCSVGDDYKRPETPTPAGWSDSQAPAAAWPSPDWWTRFDSPALNGYMQSAAQANLDIVAAIARVRQADAQAQIAGAPLLTAVDAGGGVNRSHAPVMSSTMPGKSTQTTQANTYSANLTASYQLDFWGKNAAALESAQATARASRFDRQTVALTVQSSVATTFFDMTGQQDRVVVARGNLANAQEVLSAIEDRMAAGTATDLDLAQQQNTVATAAAAIPPLEQQIRQDANALALLTGKLPQDVQVEPMALSAIALPVVAPGLPSQLLARRPDVANADALLSDNAEWAVIPPAGAGTATP